MRESSNYLGQNLYDHNRISWTRFKLIEPLEVLSDQLWKKGNLPMVWRHFVTKFSLQKNSHSYIQPWQDLDTNITSLNIDHLNNMYPVIARPSFQKFLGLKPSNHK
jgi:hypothetical protein